MKSKTLTLSLILLFYFVTIANGQWSTGTDIYSTNSGNVGIGTSTPGAKLDVWGNMLFLGGAHQFYFNSAATFDPTKAGIRNNQGNAVFNAKNNGRIYLNRDVNADVWIESSPDGVNDIEVAAFLANGNVGIGTTTPKAKLAVNGDVLAQKVTVSLTNLPDYVFNNHYPLLSLDSLKRYIQLNHQLPDVPTADSVARTGLKSGRQPGDPAEKGGGIDAVCPAATEGTGRTQGRQ